MAPALLQGKILSVAPLSPSRIITVPSSPFRSLSAFYSHGCAKRRVLVVYCVVPEQFQLLWTGSMPCQILDLCSVHV